MWTTINRLLLEVMSDKYLAIGSAWINGLNQQEYMSYKLKILLSNFRASMKQAANHILLALERSQTLDSATNTLREYCRVMSGHDDPYHEIALVTEDGNVVVSSKKVRMMDNEKVFSNDSQELTCNTYKNDGEYYTALTLPFEKQWSNNHFKGAIRYIENNNSIDALLTRLYWNRTISLIVILVVLSLITLWILKTKVITPLDQIFVQAYAVSKGDYDTWHAPDPGNEIGDIQNMVNTMVAKLNIHEQDLIKKERHSAVTETIAQVYHSIGKHISFIKTACEQCSAKDNNSLKEDLSETVIKHECEAIYEDLSKLYDLFEENEIENNNTINHN